MIPTAVLLVVALGGPKFGWLARLKISVRNCSLMPSLTTKFFMMPRSTFTKPGPSKMPRPESGAKWVHSRNPIGAIAAGSREIVVSGDDRCKRKPGLRGENAG